MRSKLKTGLIALVLGGAFLGIAGIAVHTMLVAQRTAEMASRVRQSIGTTMPEFSMPVLQQPGKHAPRIIGKRDLLGGPYLLHGWASWCVSCREEHPVIRDFVKRHRVRLIGYNVDDDPELALRWLERYGDPYEFSLVQASQQTPGVIPLTTTPQLILIDREGVVRWRYLGAVGTDILEEGLVPILKQIEGGR